MSVRMPQYLHLPTQVLWFDSHEVMLLTFAYLGALTIKGWSWLFLFAAVFAFIPYKRAKPRGYIPHLLYRAGLVSMKRYPVPAARRFDE